MFKDSGLVFNILDRGYVLKQISGYPTHLTKQKWNHVALQLEKGKDVSLLLNGNCLAAGVLSATEHTVMSKSSSSDMNIGRNSRSRPLFIDNFRIIKRAIYNESF